MYFTGYDEQLRILYFLSDNFLGGGPSAMALSVIESKINFLELFIQNGGDCHIGLIEEKDAFDIACQYNAIEVVKYLVDKKIFSPFGPQDNKGNSLLHKAAVGSTECLQFVMTKSPFANTKNAETGTTPIFDAVLAKAVENIKLLLPKSDLTVVDKAKRNILHYTTLIIPESVSVEIANMLLEKKLQGVDINGVDSEGFTAFDLASLQRNFEFCEMLLSHKIELKTVPASVGKINPTHFRSLYSKGDTPRPRFTAFSTVINGRLYRGGGSVFEDEIIVLGDLNSCDVSNIKEELLFPLENLQLLKGIELSSTTNPKATLTKVGDQYQISTVVGIEEDTPAFFVSKDILESSGVTYFEATISCEADHAVSIGYTKPHFNPEKPPRWVERAFAYHSDDGRLTTDFGNEDDELVWIGASVSSGDTMGIGYNFDTEEIFYTKNGQFISSIPYVLEDDDDALIPYISAYSESTTITLNFGNSPFRYNFTAPTVHWVEETTFDEPITAIFAHPTEENILIAISNSTKNYYKYNVITKTVDVVKTKPILGGIIPNFDGSVHITGNRIFILVRVDTLLDESKRDYPYLYCLDLTTNEWSDWIAPHKKLINILKKTENDISGYAHDGHFYFVQHDNLVKVDKSTIELLGLKGNGPSKDVRLAQVGKVTFATSAPNAVAWIPFFLNFEERQWYIAQFDGNGIYPRETVSLAVEESTNRCFISCGSNIEIDPHTNFLDEAQLNYTDANEGVLSAFNVKEVSDFTVKTSSGEFHVSKAILATRSTFFKEYFANNSGNVLEITDAAPNHVEALLRYFYADLLDFNLVAYEDESFLSFVAKYAPNNAVQIRRLTYGHRQCDKSTSYFTEAFDGDYTDVEFTFGTEGVKAHKSIIFGRNKALYALIESNKLSLEGIEFKKTLVEIVKQAYAGKYYTLPDLTVEELRDLIFASMTYSPSLYYLALSALYTKVDKENMDSLLTFGKDKKIKELESMISGFQIRE